MPVGGVVVASLVFIPIPNQGSKPPPMSVLRTLPTKLDLFGFALLAPAAIQLLLAVQYGGITFAWNSAQVIGLFCGAGGTFAVFLAWEHHKGDAAMIPFSMVRRRIIWASCLSYGFCLGQVFTVSYYLPIYFQGVKGASPTLSGVYVLPVVISTVLAAIISGILGKYLGSLVDVVWSSLITLQSEGLATTCHSSSSGLLLYQLAMGFCPRYRQTRRQQSGLGTRSLLEWVVAAHYRS